MSATNFLTLDGKLKIVRKYIIIQIILLISCSSIGAMSAPLHHNEAVAKAVKLKNYNKIKTKFQQQTTKSSRLQNSVTEPTTIRVILETNSSSASGTSILNSYRSLEKLEQRIKSNGTEIQRKLERFNLLSVEVTERQLDALFNDKDVIVLSEDKFISPSLSVSTPFIGASQLHTTAGTGNGQSVAVLDTGFDKSHPFLSNRIVEEACFSSGDQRYVFSLCPNAQNRQIGSGAARDCSSTIGVGDCMHGTHVAGIVAGSNPSMTGVAPGANIVAVQIFAYNPSFYRLGAYTSDIIAAFDWLLNESTTPNIAAINLSLGGGTYSDYCDNDVPALTDAINMAREHGIATIIASGNDGSISGVSWPGCISSAITVGATYRGEDILAGYSNTSAMVDVVAPGSDIYSSIPGGVYSSMSGTSMATPQVSGAFALLKSLMPNANVDDIELALEQTGNAVSTPIGINLPRINLLAAYEELINEGEKNGGGTVDGCISLPGTIVDTAGAIDTGSTKTWNVSINQGGLYRFWIKSDAALSSHLIRANLNGHSVDMSIGAGQTTLVDFVDVASGNNSFSVTALSDGVVLGKIWAEQLIGNNNVSSGCLAPLSAGVVMSDFGEIAEGTEKSLPIKTISASNLRVYITSTSALNSRSIMLSLDDIDISLSLDPDVKIPVDFPALPAGDHTLTIKALSDGVSIGEIEVATF